MTSPNLKKADAERWFRWNHIPIRWWDSARDLKRAGDVLFDAYLTDLCRVPPDGPPEGLENLRIAGSATLLYGLALENLLKCLRLKKRLEKYENGMIKWPGNGHDTIKLLDGTGVVVSNREKTLLRRLTAFVTWTGRYPVPRSADQMRLQDVMVEDYAPPAPFDPLGEQAVYANLYDRLERLARPKLVKEGRTWRSGD